MDWYGIGERSLHERKLKEEEKQFWHCIRSAFNLHKRLYTPPLMYKRNRKKASTSTAHHQSIKHRNERITKIYAPSIRLHYLCYQTQSSSQTLTSLSTDQPTRYLTPNKTPDSRNDPGLALFICLTTPDSSPDLSSA